MMFELGCKSVDLLLFLLVHLIVSGRNKNN